MELPEVKKAQVFEVKTGDVLFITVDTTLSMETKLQMKNQIFNAFLPREVEIIILDSGMSVEAFRAK